MYCTSCGSQNDDTARFCKDCGKAVVESTLRRGRLPSSSAGSRKTFGYYVQGLEQYADFEGRARRAEFWWFNLVLYGINIVIVILGAVLGEFWAVLETVSTVVLWIHGLALLLPQLAVTARRLHDTGKSGWWMLLMLIPILGWIPLLVFLLTPSDAGQNRYGREPG